LIKSKEGYFIFQEDYLEMDEPIYHPRAMGCGLEDLSITDRYEAMEYGWKEAIESFSREIPNFIQVEPESIGQYAEEKDITGIEIYERDVCSFSIDGDIQYRGIVTWQNSRFTLRNPETYWGFGDFNGDGPYDLWWVIELKVVGKVKENPDCYIL
jgi:hypothetical protein